MKEKTKLEEEIEDLTQKSKAANALGKRRSDAYFYRTALRIAKARQKWEQDPFFVNKHFFQEFRIGFIKKRMANFQVENNKWCGSFVPWQKFYDDSLEKVLKEMLNISW